METSSELNLREEKHVYTYFVVGCRSNIDCVMSGCHVKQIIQFDFQEKSAWICVKQYHKPQAIYIGKLIKNHNLELFEFNLMCNVYNH